MRRIEYTLLTSLVTEGSMGLLLNVARSVNIVCDLGLTWAGLLWNCVGTLPFKLILYFTLN